MCEIPSNVMLGAEFSEYVDGFSIGSNDLTQMTLGLDRDSGLVSHLFDENNEAVRRMISLIINICKMKGKKIGICGQAPSDYPEFTKFLVESGIDSISLMPDSLVKTKINIKGIEDSILLDFLSIKSRSSPTIPFDFFPFSFYTKTLINKIKHFIYYLLLLRDKRYF